MAVEKSHARLGLFLVVVLVVVLATALLFIQRWRSRAVIEMVTYTRENVSGLDVSSPVRYRGVPVGRVTLLRVDPRASTIEIDFEVFLDRLNTIGANVELLRRMADVEGMFPDLRAQVVGNPVTGEAYLLLDGPDNPPPPLELGFKPDRRVHPGDAHADGGDAGSDAGSARTRGSHTAGTQGHRREDSRQPRSERPVLHDRRAHHAGEQSAGAERRFAGVLCDDERAVRADDLRDSKR